MWPLPRERSVARIETPGASSLSRRAGLPMIGSVTAFDEAVGLGVITGADGTEYLFHCVEIADGTRTIDVGAAVEFAVLRKLGSDEASRIRPTPRT